MGRAGSLGRRPNLIMARVSLERTATGVTGPEDAADTSVSTDLQWEHLEPGRLLRRAVRLLDDTDLKDASETLKEAAREMAEQSDDTGVPQQRYWQQGRR